MSMWDCCAGCELVLLHLLAWCDAQRVVACDVVDEYVGSLSCVDCIFLVRFTCFRLQRIVTRLFLVSFDNPVRFCRAHLINQHALFFC